MKYFVPKAYNFSCRYWSVLAFGKAEIIEQPKEKMKMVLPLNFKLIRLLMEKYTSNHNYIMPDEDDMKLVNVVKINVESLTEKMNIDPERCSFKHTDRGIRCHIKKHQKFNGGEKEDL